MNDEAKHQFETLRTDGDPRREEAEDRSEAAQARLRDAADATEKDSQEALRRLEESYASAKRSLDAALGELERG